MSTLSQFGGGSIKSIQRGVINTTSTATATATISAVNPAKSILSTTGSNTNPGGNIWSYLSLTNSTTITATVSTSSSNASAIAWQLVEYY
jgi:hypothetical protein